VGPNHRHHHETCGCLGLVSQERVVLVCEAIRMCILPFADDLALPASASHLHALPLLYMFQHIKTQPLVHIQTVQFLIMLTPTI